jgi:hypothetical protein
MFTAVHVEAAVDGTSAKVAVATAEDQALELPLTIEFTRP